MLIEMYKGDKLLRVNYSKNELPGFRCMWYMSAATAKFETCSPSCSVIAFHWRVSLIAAIHPQQIFSFAQ